MSDSTNHISIQTTNKPQLADYNVIFVSSLTDDLEVKGHHYPVNVCYQNKDRNMTMSVMYNISPKGPLTHRP